MRNKECCEESGDGEGKANYTAISMGDRSSTVVKGAVLQIGRSLVRFQMVSLEFFIDITLQITLRPWG